MNEFIGRQVECGVSLEATRLTAEATIQRSIRKTNINVIEKSEKAQDDTTSGTFADMEGRRITQKFVEGDIEGIIHADAIGFFYSAMLGIVQSSVVAGSVYDHVFELDDSNIHPTLTIFRKDGDVQNIKYAGCMISSLELNVAVDDYLRYKASFQGATATDTVVTPSYATEYDFVARDVEVKIASSEAGLTGATPLVVKELTITHTKELLRDHVLGNYNPNNIYNGGHNIEGEMTLNFNSETFKDYNLGNTSVYMQIKIEGEANIGGGNKPTITYLLNKVMVEDFTPDGGTDELVTQAIKFKAYFQRSDSQQVKVTVRNLTTSYANVPSA